MKRREFLKAAVGSAVVAALAGSGPVHGSPASAQATTNAAVLPRRPFKKDVELSIVGMGGIVVSGETQEHANKTVARAVERGVNYFDVAPSYGNAEERLGPALAPFRKKCFLAEKTEKRLAVEAREELKTTLARLKTDYLDLYQLHAITDVAKDVDAAFVKGGVMELLMEARKQGQVRYLGFSAHSVEAAEAAMDRFDFDAVLFPVNFATYHQGNFGPQIVAKAKEKGLARLALKSLARQTWPDKRDPERKKWPKCWYQPLSDPREQELCARFTLDQDIASLLPPGNESLFWRAVEIGSAYKPLTELERAEVKALATKTNPLFAWPMKA